jgi:hypothetical protein
VPRSSASIQAEIDRIETLLASGQGLYTNINADGASRSLDRAGLEKRLDKLYQFLSRADGTAPMIVRGVLRGLRQ